MLLLGDYATNIFSDGGYRGDDYFEEMEPILTKAPFIMIPGNRENIDNTLYLNTRFKMPMTDTPFDNNMYAFSVGGLTFLTFNFDVILALEWKNFWKHFKAFETLSRNYVKR